jgi:hypothetical protein
MEPAKVETVVRLATPDAKLRLLADRWRARAKEILLQAATMNDADARQKMLDVAASYERWRNGSNNDPAMQTRRRPHRAAATGVHGGAAPGIGHRDHPGHPSCSCVVKRRHDEPGWNALDDDSVDRSAQSRQQRPHFGGLWRTWRRSAFANV